MVYVTSDIHGYPLKGFETLLEGAGFCDDDFLFVIGDVVDRGAEGVKLLEWLIVQPNAQLILGNHELMMLSCEFILGEITENSIGALTGKRLSLLSNWIFNGANTTINGLRELMRTSPETVGDIYDYLHEAPLYETVSAGGRDFLLVHSGLGGFRPDRPLSDYTTDELVWTRPELTDRYFDGVMTVIGHTPVQAYGRERAGRILKTETWTDIDTGAGHGGSPCLLRLNDMTEFYVE